MSRGPGKIQKAIEDAFRENPDGTFTIERLTSIAFPEIESAEKRHRVSVGRAAIKAAARYGWSSITVRRFQGEKIFFNRQSPRSSERANAQAAGHNGGTDQ